MMRSLVLGAALFVGVGCGGTDLGIGTDAGTDAGGGPGCSGTDASSAMPDFSTLDQTLHHATGTFVAVSAAAILSSLDAQLSQADFGFKLPEMSRMSVCPALMSGAMGQCPCPGGGALGFDLRANNSTVVRDMQDALDWLMYSKCDVQGQVIDGAIYTYLKTTTSPAAWDTIVVDHLSASPAGTTYDVRYRNHASGADFPAKVADGCVLIRPGNWAPSTNSGGLSIQDRTATWTCVLTGGHGTCTDGQGHSLTI